MSVNANHSSDMMEHMCYQIILLIFYFNIIAVKSWEPNKHFLLTATQFQRIINGNGLVIDN